MKYTLVCVINNTQDANTYFYCNGGSFFQHPPCAIDNNKKKNKIDRKYSENTN